jgi:hypothetical protein
MDLPTLNRTRKALVFFFSGLFFLIFSRCVTYYEEGFAQKDNKRYIFEDFYDKNDTLVLHHYIVYGTERTRVPYEPKFFPYQCNSDSIFESFKNSFLLLDVPLTITKYGINKAADTSSGFSSKHFPNTKMHELLFSIDKVKYILEFTSDYPDQTVIVPFVWIDFGICDTHRCAYNGSYYDLTLSLTIYVIRNNSIRYHKRLSRFTELDGKYQTKDFQACDVRIDPELIDRLVKQVMIDYTNRLK